MNDPRAVNSAHSSIASESTQSFVDAMAMAATGVTVVVTDGPAGRAGITVSAFTSVSADPPLVLICVNRKSAAVEPITANAQFCVNLLGEAHQPLANIFASRDASAKTAALEAQNWAPGLTGLLLVPDAPAAFECTLQETVDAGTHRIFIGRVVKAHHSQTPTLAYSRRTYSRLAPL